MEKQLKSIFDSYDEDTKQKLSFDEFKAFIEDLGLFGYQEISSEKQVVFEEYLDELWEKFDQNGDNFITYEEFVGMYNILIKS